MLNSASSVVLLPAFQSQPWDHEGHFTFLELIFLIGQKGYGSKIFVMTKWETHKMQCRDEGNMSRESNLNSSSEICRVDKDTKKKGQTRSKQNYNARASVCMWVYALIKEMMQPSDEFNKF